MNQFIRYGVALVLGLFFLLFFLLVFHLDLPQKSILTFTFERCWPSLLFFRHGVGNALQNRKEQGHPNDNNGNLHCRRCVRYSFLFGSAEKFFSLSTENGLFHNACEVFSHISVSGKAHDSA